MTNAEKEIRSVLLGRTLMREDGTLSVPEKGEFYLSGGVTDGAGALRFLGMSKKSIVLETRRVEWDVKQTLRRIFQSMGRGVNLREQPETIACIIRYVLTKPLLLTFEYREGFPVVTAWTGRSPMGLLSIRRAFKTIEKELPQDIFVTGKEAPAAPEGETDKKKKSDKEAKRAEKQAKKREKQEEKARRKEEEQRLKEEEKVRQEAAASGDFWMLKEDEDHEHEYGSDQTRQ